VLAVALAKKLLAAAEGFQASDITHVVFASCTGFANPGPDYHIIRELGLGGHVERYTLGFMGCYAAFPALRMAAQFCEANPKAVVLVMCLELCSLHMQINDQPDSILANSLFADGAAAALVSSRKPLPGRPGYKVHAFSSALVTDGEADMAWDIGNEGFNIVLSSYVPEILGKRIAPLLEEIVEKSGLDLSQIEEWAVHPGGRAILDKVGASLGLAPEALAASRQVLRDYGNMSSATILFVLKELLDSADTDQALSCAMAFGPGLTVETAVLERCGRTVTPARPVHPVSANAMA
jgi:predicted naringenin-chalcone synthase